MEAQRLQFPGSDGQQLSARLDLPVGPVRTFALFAHCFTCGKDVLAATRIAQALTAHGIAVLRFDFTGLGGSGGDFANTNFSSNVADLLAAAAYLRQHHRAPALLIGHSLGGAAILSAALGIPEAKAVVAIAAPSDPSHVVGLFKDQAARIEADGEAEVSLAGRPFRIKRQFIEDVAEQKLLDGVARLRKALLVMHAPQDDTVGIDNATQIFIAAKHPKSFVSLDRADHLLTRKEDAVYVANTIAAWSQRYLDIKVEEVPAAVAEEGLVRVEESHAGKYQQRITAGPHHLLADEPVSFGGLNGGPAPYDLLLAALGACTAMTMRMYAERKGFPLEHVAVSLRHEKIHAADCAECSTTEGKIDWIEREITMRGPLDEAQRAALLEIADKCPVHRTLHSEVMVRTHEAETAAG
ncbi:bifunctional alpha/beta hydrolase/OsmC family protein [Cupriavidus basilensis]|uniref:bifunctional alpha/beta hydrolase/OsmC family protein n=1 Tax=Cupriavidus TaxID=106589 RepID=UPI0004539B9D|nr:MULTISPECIES: bifunctional alpha/beta hydrolase/OsmC family protein [Cupriavidus]KDP84623.1 osmotically inducible protein C [Cupriavidus sp. SK-3]MDF3885112.1 bifunctional alpha/beta hydrolase/OsmC family protein [Cupriavidus basilensis]